MAEKIETSGTNAFSELEKSVAEALETYSNVHRGSGHFSIATTHLFEKSREIILDHLGLSKASHILVFCSKAREEAIRSLLPPRSFRTISSADIYLPIGVYAIAIKKENIPAGKPFETGGGTSRLVHPDWVVWADSPARLEAGTPAIINVIAFARALQITSIYGKDVFAGLKNKSLSAEEILYRDNLEHLSGKSLISELRNTLFGNRITVPSKAGRERFINLDNGASTPAFLPVFEAFCITLKQPVPAFNEITDEVRSICASMLDAPQGKYQILFTSNATEAINIAASAFSGSNDSKSMILNTILEHNSNDLPWRGPANKSVVRLPVDSEGFLDTATLENELSRYDSEAGKEGERIGLMAVTGASNVLGSCNNMSEISNIVHNHGAVLMIDAAQLAAHRKIEMDKWDADILALSAHKAYAPFGAGVLVIRKGLPDFDYAELEKAAGLGEDNVAGIAALGKAFVLLQRAGIDTIMHEEQDLTAAALNKMNSIKGITIHGITDPGSPRFGSKAGVISFSMKTIWPDKIAEGLAETGGIGIRYGCHCAHLLVKHILNVGPFLQGFQRIIAVLFHSLNFPGVARVSLGIGNTEDDIDKLVLVLKKLSAEKKTGKDPAPKLIKKQMEDFTKEAEHRVFGPLT